MEAHIDDAELAKLRQLSKKTAEFVALYESASEKLETRERAIDEKLLKGQQLIDGQLHQIQDTLERFSEIMSEAGAARWRVAAEKALSEGEEHLHTVQMATSEFIDYTKKACDKLDKASTYAVKNVSKAVNSFHIDDFKTLTAESARTVKQTCANSIKKVNDVIRWFHWRNLAMVLSITIVVTMTTGLYMNDEWPWQMHQEVMQQRELASAVVKTWPNLSSRDQKLILDNTQKSHV